MDASNQSPAPRVTTIRVIENERELYKEYRNVLREASKIAVSIDKIPDEQGTQIENAVQELLTAEAIRQAHDELRARGVSEEFLDESGLRTSLDELPLPESDRRILEAKIRQLSRRTTRLRPIDGDGGVDREDSEEPPARPRPPRRPSSGTIQQASHISDHICICMVTGIPGAMISLINYNPSILPPAHTIAFLPPSGDAVICRVEPGAPFGIGPTEIRVGLASAVSWAKEIVAWHLCRGRLSTVFQEGTNSTANFMLLERGCDGADTIIFRKPGFLGIWVDVFHLESRLFWPMFGGKRLTFTWLID